MIRKIAGNNIVQESKFIETKPDETKVDRTQQLNQNINPTEAQKFSSAIAAERKFTGSITETIVRRTLENQLQSNFALSNDTYVPANSGAENIAGTLSRMQEEYKKQQAQHRETTKLWATVKPEMDPATDAMNKVSVGTETAKVDQKVPIVGVNEIGRLSSEPLPSIPVNSGVQDIADTLSRMQEEYKKQQAQHRETAKLWASVKPEMDPATDEMNKVSVGTETAKVDQKVPIVGVNEIGRLSSEPLPSAPVNSGAQEAADIFSGMEEAYKKQQEEQKKAVKLGVAVLNQDLPDV